MSITQSAIDRLAVDVGELIARRDGAGRDFSAYADDPVRFIREVLGGDPWERQIEIAEAVRDRPQVTVRSCHAAGKDWLAARLALWWAYARRGLVLLTGPTASQVEEILMRREVREAFMKGRLPGELHVRALRPGGDGEAGILARTSSGVAGMTGFHDARVLFVITEAQDPEIEHAWDAGFAVTTGHEDRMLTLGNPTEPDGRFYRAHRAGSGWTGFKIAADDVPNVAEGRTVVPGLITLAGKARFAREYGESSGFFVSRVLAEFPAQAEDALVRAEWVDEAVAGWAGAMRGAGSRRARTVLGVDPARHGPDRTTTCVRRGPVVEGFVDWRGADTMQSADRVADIVRRLEGQGRAVAEVLVDEVGVGGGVLDRLKEVLADRRARSARDAHARRPWCPVKVGPFNAARVATQPSRFRNLRAQGYWTLRKMLEERSLALPDHRKLREEILATRVRYGPDGRAEIESKDAIRARLGRSPDFADALVISLAPELWREGRRKPAFR